jgi:hypothetical protein
MPASGKGRLRCGVVRLAKRRAHDQTAILKEAGDAVNHSNFERGSSFKIRKQSGQSRREHGLTRSRWANQQDVVTARRRHFDGSPGGFHALDVTHIWATSNLDNTAGDRRRQKHGTFEMAD